MVSASLVTCAKLLSKSPVPYVESRVQLFVGLYEAWPTSAPLRKVKLLAPLLSVI